MGPRARARAAGRRGRRRRALRQGRSFASCPEGLALVGALPREDPRDALCGRAGRGARRDLVPAPGGPAPGRGRRPRRRRGPRQRRHAPAQARRRGLRRPRARRGGPAPPRARRRDRRAARPRAGRGAGHRRAGGPGAASPGRGGRPGLGLPAGAERAVVRELQADCHSAVGAHAAAREEAACTSAPGSGPPTARRGWPTSSTATRPEALGTQVARRLLAAGARELLSP